MSTPRVRSPSDAPYTAAASPAGPPPTMTRSKQRSGRFPTVKPRYSASAPGVGRRRTVPEMITTGSSAGVTPTSRRSRSTASSLSGSSHSCGMRLRARNSRTGNSSGEYREPTTRMAVVAPLRSAVRRAMKALRMVSPRWGCVASTLRSSAAGTAMISPGSATRADTNTRSPVSMFNSPRNRPAPWWAMTRSSPSDSIRISTTPDTTT